MSGPKAKRPSDMGQAQRVSACIGRSFNAGADHSDETAARYDALGEWFNALVDSHNRLLFAAKVTLSGLNARIDKAVAEGGTAVPVFDGIVDLHEAIAKAEGRA